jgi:hypothetical protein
MISIPNDCDTLLSRDQAATTLREAGFPVSKATLATMASRGHGPIYRRFGPRALYRWGDLITWAEGRLSAPRRSTSERDALRAAHGRGRRIASTYVPRHDRP